MEYEVDWLTILITGKIKDNLFFIHNKVAKIQEVTGLIKLRCHVCKDLLQKLDRIF